MPWTLKAYYKRVFLQDKMQIVGWDPLVPFMNLSKITGLTNISRLASRWNSGKMYFARVSDEEYEAARRDPLLAAPSPLHDHFEPRLGRDDVKRRYKTTPGFPARYVRDGPKSAKTVTVEAEAAAVHGMEDPEDPITMFSDDEDWPARGGRTRVWVDGSQLVVNPIRWVKR